jgi:hypothetical protein
LWVTGVCVWGGHSQDACVAYAENEVCASPGCKVDPEWQEKGARARRGVSVKAMH